MTNRKGTKFALLAGASVLVVAVVALCLNWPRIVAWYEFRQLFESLGINAQGYPEYRHRQAGIVFVHLPGGTFLMGSPEDEDKRTKAEGPQHEVTLSPFLIAKYEIVQAEWRTVMGTSPSAFSGDRLPVEQVSWEDCQGFCEKTGARKSAGMSFVPWCIS